MSTINDFPPLPSPPFHTVPNINNLRDAALFPLITPSGPIRPSILFRSADVSKLDTLGWHTLRTLGISHVFDLRSAPEVGFTDTTTSSSRPAWITAMQSAGINRTWVPVFTEQDYSPEGLATRYMKYMDESVQGFVSAYHDILANGGPAYAQIFRYLANSPGEGALIHCTAGKDRTGIFFGVLLSYLGVDKEAIAHEYNLTESGLRGVREEVVARLLQSPAFKNYIRTQETGVELSAQEIGRLIADEKAGKSSGAEDEAMSPEARAKGREAALRMIGAKKETMLAALDMVDKEFGGAEKYMREVCGLSEGEMEALKKNLIVNEAS
jgi:protein tyrosine/serine phosphatase